MKKATVTDRRYSIEIFTEICKKLKTTPTNPEK